MATTPMSGQYLLLPKSMPDRETFAELYEYLTGHGADIQLTVTGTWFYCSLWYMPYPHQQFSEFRYPYEHAFIKGGNALDTLFSAAKEVGLWPPITGRM